MYHLLGQFHFIIEAMLEKKVSRNIEVKIY